MFTSADIAEYYNTTQNHYRRWWGLDKSLSLHYGIWDKSTKNFSEALINTNRILMKTAKIKSSDKILDAGCGVGGAAFFVNEQVRASVIGITLSQKQLDLANKMAKEKGVHNSVQFMLIDYTKTSFADESFDVVWACESVSSAQDKQAFLKEAYRIIKKGGRLILSDYFLTDDNLNAHNLIRKWTHTWSISNLVSQEKFTDFIIKEGFSSVDSYNYSNKIYKSAKRMYYASLLGALPSELYNLTHPKVSRFAKTHYKSGLYQYQALKKGLWNYIMFCAVK